jgi:uncharacterized protein YkwD
MKHVVHGLLLCCLAVGVLRATQTEDKPADRPKEKTADKFEMTPDEKTILDLVNTEREMKKVTPLKPSPLLFKVARAHSDNMAKQNKMAHILDGKDPVKRVQEAGYKSPWVGENVAAGYEFGAKDAFEAWMKSKPHRENIQNGTYQEIGIGIARSEKGELYYTQVFARLPRRR